MQKHCRLAPLPTQDCLIYLQVPFFRGRLHTGQVTEKLRKIDAHVFLKFSLAFLVVSFFSVVSYVFVGFCMVFHWIFAREGFLQISSKYLLNLPTSFSCRFSLIRSLLQDAFLDLFDIFFGQFARGIAVSSVFVFVLYHAFCKFSTGFSKSFRGSPRNNLQTSDRTPLKSTEAYKTKQTTLFTAIPVWQKSSRSLWKLVISYFR